MSNSRIEKKREFFKNEMDNVEYDYEIADQNFDFIQERNYIADKYGYKPWEISFDFFHPCGSICIFAKDVWLGYVDLITKEEIENFYKKLDKVS